MRRTGKIIALAILWSAPLRAQAPLPRIHAHDNRVPAGVMKAGVLTLHLDIMRGMFYPDADTDPGVDVLAFAEAGSAPSIPGPLIRVPIGTEIHTTVRNALPDSAITVHGLSGGRTPGDSVRLQPGESRELVTTTTATGTFLYYAALSKRPDPFGDDRMLVGAFIVDPRGQPINDRIFVVLQWLDSLRLKESPGVVAEVNTINGKAWPNTERLDYNLGDTITWRVINGSFGSHPMHLHGTYFNVVSRGKVGVDTLYAPEQQRKVVTQRLAPLTTMVMRWAPERAGNWLFHCHLTFHVMAHPTLGAMKASDDHAGHMMMSSMGGLILGTTVHGPIAADVRPRRNIRLVVNQYDSIPGEYGPPFSFELDDVKRMSNPGPPIIVTRDQPIAITVVNRARTPTSVHWHGLEIESYYDGVPLFGGTPQRITPLVMPHDSFVVKMTPPRAGTFIYHSHADEARQQGGGLHGAFIVLPPGKKWDPEHERIIMLATPRDTGALDINGENAPTIEMKAGVTYRVRLINITLDRPSIVATLSNGDKLEEWRALARDGADLPINEATVQPARIQITIGETDDFLYTPAGPGDRRFEVKAGNGVLLRAARVKVD